MTAQATSEQVLIGGLASLMRTPKLRTIGEWAEQEVVLPDGPCEGRRFRLDRSPVARLLFAELDSGRWRRVFVTGPNQDGKSLIGFVIPTLYRLLERAETVVLGVPSMDIATDKIQGNLLPVLRQTRYADLLPTSGSGSRDGATEVIRFGNGAVLRVMTAGGGDQARSHFTTPNLHVTETDGFDHVGGSSREGDKFSQLERRLVAFGRRAKTLAECTVSSEEGRTWREFRGGTESRIAVPCPHCGEYVTPGRDDFAGWEVAKSDLEAVRLGAIHCPSCRAAWTNDERMDANARAVLAHRGQTVGRDGTVSGAPPDTDTLGFRWTAVNSVLDPDRLPMVAGEEWRAKRAPDEDTAETDLRQKHWVIPAKPARQDVSGLDAVAISKRIKPNAKRGVCPAGTTHVTVAGDVGKHRIHWTAIAWLPGATPHVVDYGIAEVHQPDGEQEEAVVERHILSALADWRDSVVKDGWEAVDGGRLYASFAFVDSGKWTNTIYVFCQSSGPAFWPVKGFGFGQRDAGKVKRDTGSVLTHSSGDGYAVWRLSNGTEYVEIDVDRWKVWLHRRLHSPIGDPGAMTIFDGSQGERDHHSFAKHLTAERQVERWSPEQGTVLVWESRNRNNHWLDATAYACVAGHAAGLRVVQPPPAETPTPRPPSARVRDDDERRGGWERPDVSAWKNR